MKFWTFLRRKRREDELDEEIRHHLAIEIEERIRSGASPEEATRDSYRDFGNQLLIKDVTRDVWRCAALESLGQDVRYCLRLLRRNPGFTGIVILTLALGIGMNTAVFSVVDAVLFRPVAYPGAERLVWLADYDFKYSHVDNEVSRVAFLAWKNQARSFDGMAAYGNQDLALMARGEAGQERIASITGDFWSITGALPSFGRLFRPEELNTIVLSYGLFERRSGADARVIGNTLTVNGWPFTIVGVLPKSFPFLFPQQWSAGDERREVDAFIPVPDAFMRLPEISWRQEVAAAERLGPAPHAICVVARRKPSVSFEQARTEMQIIWDRVAQASYPGWKREFVRLSATPLKEKLVGDTRRSLIVLLGAVVFVLLIATSNVVNLLLARASTRHKEIAIRAAVGAARKRLISQFLVESTLLAFLGGTAGLILAHWGLGVLVRLGSAAIPRLAETKIDPPVLLFTLAVSLTTGILCGLGPAIAPWNADFNATLKSDRRIFSAGTSGLRVREGLVAVELALAIVLLTGAGLLLKSFWQMNASPSGVAPAKSLVMRISLSGPRYNAWLPKQVYLHELLRRLGTERGVEAGGVDCGTFNTSVQVTSSAMAPPGEQGPFAAVRFVSPGYLRAIGAPLVKGRWPADNDLFAVLVNETFARKLSGDPIGSHIGGSFLSGTIVGVVADFKYWQLDAETSPEVYYPYERAPMSLSTRVVVRTAGDAAGAAPAIRKLISEIDPTQPVYELQTLEQALADSITPRRFNLFLLGTFAATALLLALIGIYGVIAYSVTRRMHEIGIRMALGARRGEIVWMVIRQGMAFALLGIAMGLLAALGLTRLMASMLYEVKTDDASTFAAVALLLGAASLFACFVPALRAAAADPLVALRHE